MNTGENRVKSKNNLVTGVAWGLDGKVNYAIEGSAFNAGSVIKWLRDDLRLIDSARRCDELAESVDDANGIYLFLRLRDSALRIGICMRAARLWDLQEALRRSILQEAFLRQ